jgi:hypothetical protein
MPRSTPAADRDRVYRQQVAVRTLRACSYPDNGATAGMLQVPGLQISGWVATTAWAGDMRRPARAG